jgi:hypothetical protein
MADLDSDVDLLGRRQLFQDFELSRSATVPVSTPGPGATVGPLGG